MKNLALALALLPGLLALTSCQDPTGPAAIAMLLQVRVIQAPTTPSGTVPTRAPGVEAIDIQEAVVVLGGLRLLGEEPNGPEDWTLEESVVVPLRLGGDPILAFSTTVPEGRYRQLDTWVDKLESDDPDESALINVFPRLEETSLFVRGTITRDGVDETFEFKSAVDIDMELPFPRAESFSSDFNTVKIFTLTFDLDQWFATGPGGPLLDPEDDADRGAIEATLEASADLFKGP